MQIKPLHRYWAFAISILILIFLLIASTAYSQELKDSSACVSIQSGSAAKMVVELEQCRVKAQQLDNVTGQLTELQTQVGNYGEIVLLFQQKEELYKQIILLQQQQITAAEEAMKQYRDHIKFVQESYQQLLKDAKPSPIMDFLKSILFMGAGVAAGAVLR